ncbi:MAG: 30S ribosomal protein S7 [Actinobacteria bacterium]|nr:30S ribosomal protein S7 [Actinomycetota bacterium]MCL5770746.1 30S ribosomal protein S7 [Actinomycetota bacterium]
MARKGRIPKKELAADPIYKSKMVTEFINKILWRGKKSTAEEIVYGSFEILGKKTKENPLDILEKCMENVRPALEIRPRRVGGATYQVPVEVSHDRANTLAIRWLISFSRKRREKTMAERLAGEILDAASNTGSSVKKKEDLHKMAEANKAFAHYRW